MIFDTMAALTDFSDLDFNGNATEEQIAQKMLDLKNRGLLSADAEMLNVAGAVQDNTFKMHSQTLEQE